MRSYRFSKLNSLDDLVLSDELMPEPQRGELLIRVRAVSLNYRDIAPVLGRYVWAAKLGLIPCSDAAGDVVFVGEGVSTFRPGDRVLSAFHPRWFSGLPPASLVDETYGTGQDGWLAEYKVVSQEAVVPFPAALSYEEAATLPCAGLTAWNALVGADPMIAGKTVLTLGSGGVSVFAIQFAKALGADVIATTSSASKVKALEAFGADRVVNYSEIDQWGRHVKTSMTGGVGVDCVVEVAGPATINKSLDAVRRGGEIVIIGFLSDEGPPIDYFHLKGSGARLRSIGVGDRTILTSLVRAVGGMGIKPVIHRTFEFEDARAAFQHLLDGQHVGKVVVRLAD